MVSYEDVACAAFGKHMKLWVLVMIFFLCWMIIVAYLVLAGAMALRTYEAFIDRQVLSRHALLLP